LRLFHFSFLGFLCVLCHFAVFTFWRPFAMKVLIAGLGSIGRRHLRNLLALGERDILLYRTRQATLPEADLAGLPVEIDLAAALAWRPQAVIVSNPTALHLEVAIPAAEAGCHLLLEKPISHSLEGVDRLQEAVQRSGARVLVGFQFRFHPGLRQASQLLQAGAIGRPVSARAHWGEWLPGWHPWEDYRAGYSARPDLGGGVVLTLSHPLDYLRWLLGEVTDWWAFTARLGDLQLEVEDTAEIGLRFANGVLGSVHLDYNQLPPTHTLEIIGTRGTLRWDNSTGALSVYALPASGMQTGQEAAWQTIPVPPGFERNQLFLDEMRNFLAVARGEAQPACTLDDGLQALRLALACLKASNQ
jgi:predicted dehydrogenase